MDHQHAEIYAPTARARVEPEVARTKVAPPIKVAPKPSRRSRLRWLFWVLLVLAIIGAVVWYYPRPESQPKIAARNQFGGPVPIGVATVKEGDMPVTLTGLGTVTPLATIMVKTQIN